ncbi:nucleoside-diphosphate-sugar epimerase family protein [Colletotrichum incanum]|uniref:Nucleoside-diphosphate-sugar epimerase family protein n=1 Tax=Colletotrichum incanum TaxID=1573173 RepID=A0A167ARN5_COLIC|nr:nucleoside-diphosphate-sugar epimerase family protein [Colletotrichum incanum]
MSRALLITGATGKQGGAVVNALLSRQLSDFLLARLAAKPPSIKLAEGDLDAAQVLFASAKTATSTGVFFVQAICNQKSNSETKQGKALIGESIKPGLSTLFTAAWSVAATSDRKAIPRPYRTSSQNTRSNITFATPPPTVRASYVRQSYDPSSSWTISYQALWGKCFSR